MKATGTSTHCATPIVAAGWTGNLADMVSPALTGPGLVMDRTAAFDCKMIGFEKSEAPVIIIFG